MNYKLLLIMTYYLVTQIFLKAFLISTFASEVLEIYISVSSWLENIFHKKLF